MIDLESDVLLHAHQELKETSPELAEQLHQIWEMKMKESMLNKPNGFEYVEVRARDLKEGMEIINLGVVASVTIDELHATIRLHSPFTNVDEVVVSSLKRLKVRVR